MPSIKSKITNEEDNSSSSSLSSLITKYYIDPSLNQTGNFDNYLTTSLGFLNTLPEFDWIEDINHRKVKLPNITNKKTLILDIDETLIHSDSFCQDFDATLELSH